jgi:hypothetical protein
MYFYILSVVFLQEVEDPKIFTSFKERLHHLQVLFFFFFHMLLPTLYKILISLLFFWSNIFINIYLWFQRTENRRVSFGKSGIHGWGLFARRNIQEGEMVRYTVVHKSRFFCVCVYICVCICMYAYK